MSSSWSATCRSHAAALAVRRAAQAGGAVVRGTMGMVGAARLVARLQALVRGRTGRAAMRAAVLRGEANDPGVNFSPSSHSNAEDAQRSLSLNEPTSSAARNAPLLAAAGPERS